MTKNGALWNSNINRMFLQRLPIQNHWKLSVTEKKRNKTKYLTRNSITPACQTLLKALDTSSAAAGAAPDLFKALAIQSDATVRRSSVDQKDLKPYWKSEKRPHFYK